MAADWDTSSYDADTDTVKISETSTTTTAYDAYEVDPDAENYANGNDPETAYQNQGRSDSPNGLGSYTGDDRHQDDWDGQVDYADTTGENTETGQTGHDDQTLDMWGDTDPDAANYADLDHVGADRSDGQAGNREDGPAPDAGIDTDASQPDQNQHAEGNTEKTAPSEEQQQISALEAENADARQQIADANDKIAGLEAKNNEQATQLNEQAARLDRIEQLLAGSEKDPDDASIQEHGDSSASSVEKVQGSASVERSAAMAERKNSDEGTSTKQSRDHGWRRVTSSEGLGLIGTFGGAAQAIGDFAAHATPEGSIGLGLTAVGVAQVLRARAEKKAERNGKR